MHTPKITFSTFRLRIALYLSILMATGVWYKFSIELAQEEVHQNLQHLNLLTQQRELSQRYVNNLVLLEQVGQEIDEHSQKIRGDLANTIMAMHSNHRSLQALQVEALKALSQFSGPKAHNPPRFTNINQEFERKWLLLQQHIDDISSGNQQITEINVAKTKGFIEFEFLPALEALLQAHLSSVGKNTHNRYASILVIIILIAFILVSLEYVLVHRHKNLAERQFRWELNRDGLTGLLDRRGFDQNLQVELSKLDGIEPLYFLFYISINEFAFFSENAGSHNADKLLAEYGRVLLEKMSDHGALARVSNDAFACIVKGSRHEARQEAAKLIAFNEGFQFDCKGALFHFDIAIGVHEFGHPDSSSTPDELVRKAFEANRLARIPNTSMTLFFDEISHDQVKQEEELKLVSQINTALKSDSFELFAQSIVPIAKNTMSSTRFEILLRMKVDDDYVSPALFIPIAEKYKLNTTVDRWVTEHVIDYLLEHPDFCEYVDVIAINLSADSITKPEFIEELLLRVSSVKHLAHKLCFEITETALVSNIETATGFISAIKSLGCKIALDDFGSGLSSFAYLKQLDVDTLKIDGYFIRNIDSDDIAFEMVKAMHDIGALLGKTTVAEYVENELILARLQEIGVGFAQGYHFGRPRPLEEYAVKVKRANITVAA